MNKIKRLAQIISMLFLVVVLFQNVFAQSRTERVLTAEAERITKDNFLFSAQSKKGARVFSVNKPTSKMLDAIDKGLTDLFAIARKNNYTNKLSYSDYTIFIAKADRTTDINKNYSPDIAIGAAQYAGSVYDKGGFVYAAGMILAFKPCAFIIAEHTKEFNRVSEVVRYEGEHLILYHNDRQLYNKTADHSKGGGHPILQ